MTESKLIPIDEKDLLELIQAVGGLRAVMAAVDALKSQGQSVRSITAAQQRTLAAYNTATVPPAPNLGLLSKGDEVLLLRIYEHGIAGMQMDLNATGDYQDLLIGGMTIMGQGYRETRWGDQTETRTPDGTMRIRLTERGHTTALKILQLRGEERAKLAK